MDYVELTSEILDHIETNLKSPLPVDAVAGEFLVSRYYFGRIFKAITGYAPADYIRRRKIAEAAKEIAAGKGRVLDVALDYGFESHEVFSPG